jgi:hypothetical protein
MAGAAVQPRVALVEQHIAVRRGGVAAIAGQTLVGQIAGEQRGAEAHHPMAVGGVAIDALHARVQMDIGLAAFAMLVGRRRDVQILLEGLPAAHVLMAEQAVFSGWPLGLARGQQRAILGQRPGAAGILHRKAQTGVVDRRMADQAVDARPGLGGDLFGRGGQRAAADVTTAAAAGDVQLLVQHAQPIDGRGAGCHRAVLIQLAFPGVMGAVDHIVGDVSMAHLAGSWPGVLLDGLMRLRRLGLGQPWQHQDGQQESQAGRDGGQTKAHWSPPSSRWQVRHSVSWKEA